MERKPAKVILGAFVYKLIYERGYSTDELIGGMFRGVQKRSEKSATKD